MTPEVTLVFAAFIGIFLYVYKWKRASLPEFPGPIGIPFFGNALQVNFDNLHQSFAPWEKRFGGTFKIDLFGQSALVVSSADALHEVLVTKGKDFSGRIVSERSRMAKLEQGISFLQFDSEFKEIRKCLHQVLRVYGTVSGFGILEEITASVINDAVKEIEEFSGGELDLKPVIYKTAQNLMLKLLFGKTFCNGDTLIKMIQETDKLSIHLFKPTTLGLLIDRLPLVKYLPICKEFCQNLERFSDAIWELVSWMHQEGRTEKTVQTFTHLKQLMDSSVNIRTGAGRLVPVALMLGDTTTSILYALINILLHKPSIYDRLQEEIIGNLGARQVMLNDKERLPYLMAAIHETLRYCSVTPILTPHVAAVNTTLDGKFVPAGTVVYADIMTLHHDPEVFPEPWEFKPERFLDDAGKFVTADHQARKNLYAFGAGPKGCPGKTLAKNRLFLLAASLIQKYKFTKGSVVSHFSSGEFVRGFTITQKPYTVFAKAHSIE